MNWTIKNSRCEWGVCVLSGILMGLFGLCGCTSSNDGSKNIGARTSERKSSQAESDQLVNDPEGTIDGLISEKEAREIGRKHFGYPAGSGIYLDDRGKFFFVAPPIKTEKHSEKAGVLIDKRTGEVVKNNP